ncbi:MAG TPA: hypothetical protein VI541_01745 [Actinomycetota bacterium]|nr:hypothetical protein [Actinomycetota bacterium]
MRAHVLRRIALGALLGMAAMTANLAGATQSAPPYQYGSPSKSFVRDVTMQGSANAVATVDGSSAPVLNSNGGFSVSASATSAVPYVTNVSDKGLGYNSAYAQVFFHHEFTVTTPTLYSVTSTLNFTGASGTYSAAPPIQATIYSAGGYGSQLYLKVYFYPSSGPSTQGSGQNDYIPLGTNTSKTLVGSVTASSAGKIVIEVLVQCNAYAQGTASASIQAAGTLTTTLAP